MNWKVWLKNLVSATLSGAATGASTAISTAYVAPETFNTGAGLKNLLVVAGVAAGAGAITGLVNYIKKSPLAK